MRQSLPSRRRSEILSLQFGGIPYVVNFSRFADGRLAEIFVDAAKIGEPLNVLGRDLAIVASIALQHGADANEIRAALERTSAGEPAGPLAAILDAIQGEPA